MDHSFSLSILNEFIAQHKFTITTFPYTSYGQFLKFFVDDLAVHTKKNLSNAIKIHFLCIQSVFFALKRAGWVISLQLSTICNPHFIFLGLKWNMINESSSINIDQLYYILNMREPRSVAEYCKKIYGPNLSAIMLREIQVNKVQKLYFLDVIKFK